MKKLLISFNIICTSFCIQAQNSSIYAELNYNTFMHSSLKKFQKEFISDLPEIRLQENDKFPSNVGFTVGYKINKINTSFFFSYNYTGGKLSYSDYSGVIRIEEPLKGYTVGGNYQFYLEKLSNNNHEFYFGLKGFLTYSTLGINSYSQILDNINDDSISFNALDIGVGANLIYEYPISFFKIRAVIGIDAVIGDKLLFQENNKAHLENDGGDPVKTGWSGVRTGVGISIPI